MRLNWKMNKFLPKIFNNGIDSLNLIEKKWYYKSELFNIIKYNKTKFNSNAGLFRSVICKNKCIFGTKFGYISF